MIDTLLPILRLTHSFNSVLRDPKIFDLSRNENDSEHSYQLAIIAWYIANQMKLPLNKERLLQYALVHDLVEVYAGDTAPFTSDQEHNKKISESKEQREEAALHRLRKEFPDFTEMTEVIERYEKKIDSESRFVYIVDKVIPDLNCYLSGEMYYKDRRFSYSQWVEWFEGKIKKLGKQNDYEKAILDGYYNFMTEHRDYFFPA